MALSQVGYASSDCQVRFLVNFRIHWMKHGVARCLLWPECGREDVEKRRDRPFCCYPSYRDREVIEPVWICMRLHAPTTMERRWEREKEQPLHFYYIYFVYRISDNCCRDRDTFVIGFCTASLLNLLTRKSCSEMYAFRAATATVWNT